MKRFTALITIASLLFPFVSHAQWFPGSLIKGSGPAVYYYGYDGYRYVFPNDKVYFSWYHDFSDVETITDEVLAAIMIGGNVTYKPGVHLVKIQTDPKVYAVGGGSLLRWVTSESVAVGMYGATWAQNVHDIPDAFFTDYEIGKPILLTSDYDQYHSLYVNADIDSLPTSGDISELPADLPIYPNGNIQSIQNESYEDQERYGYAMDVTDTEEVIFAWFDARMMSQGWEVKELSLLDVIFGSLLNVKSYTKAVGTDQQAEINIIATCVVTCESIMVSMSVSPLIAAIPVPEIVPIYPNADELFKFVMPEEPSVQYVGFSIDTPQTVFQWYQGQLAAQYWVEVEIADDETGTLRRYERKVGNQLVNFGLGVAPVANLGVDQQFGDYKTAIVVMYGLADREEFVNFGE